ncbi:thioredoxin 1 [Amycolatopsis xylanica]|uniref:Thioredoxin n=2 Tax=Amycolatopsis xylanica TaxID=589385 RepID=A0A1H3J3V8_9PSEU|nr:thioredoxin 1 [Amycolatopsis xylanica]
MSYMATIDLTAATFDETVENHDFVVIDFWAGWCVPCRQFAPTYEKVSENHDDILFTAVDTEAEQQLAAAFEVRSIPTLAIIREKVLVYAQPGALSEAGLEELLKTARELDMAKVHAEATPNA